MGGILLSRAYGATLAIGLAALLVSLRFGSLAVSLGVAAGTALATGVLASWHLIVTRMFVPDAKRKGLAVAIGLVKLPVVGGLVYVLVGREWVSPPAFAVGLLVPEVAIGLLALGGWLGQQSGQPCNVR